MFLDRKNQYCENDCTTKCNQQIQCNPYQITNGIFHSSVQFSHRVVSDSLWPHEPQHARAPCPSPTLGVYPNSCPLSRWHHPAISPSGIPFFSCPQSLAASGSFPMCQFFTSGGPSIWASASASVLPMNIQGWFPLGLIALISWKSKGLSRVLWI